MTRKGDGREYRPVAFVRTLVMVIHVGKSRKGSWELPLKCSVHDCR